MTARILWVCLGLVGLGCPAAIAAGETELDEVLVERAAIAQALTAASGEFSVPLPLLQAIAYEATRWQHILPRKPDEVLLTYGVMALSDDNWLGKDLDAAAELLQTDTTTVKYDLGANVRGAAALLHHLANGVAPEDRPARDDLSTWRAVLERYSGLAGDDLRRRYADEIYALLAGGVSEPGVMIPEHAGLLPELESPAGVPAAQVGEYPDALWLGPVPRSNYGAQRDGEAISQIILHTLEVSTLTAVSWFRNPEAGASVHYVIDTEGTVFQLLEEAHTGYAAGNLSYNRKAVHIELEGYAGSSLQGWQSEEQLRALVRLTRWLRERYTIPLDRSHLLGHNQIPSVSSWCDGPEYWGGCSNHFDPGPFFDFTRLMASLGRAPLYRVVRALRTCPVKVLPDEDAPRATAIEAGSEFVAYDLQGDHYLIFLVGLEDPQPHLEDPGEYHWDGWVAADCLDANARVDQLEVKGTFPTTLRIRAGPSSAFPTVARGADGQRLVPTGTTRADPDDPARTWYQVFITMGQLGWVRDDFVNLHVSPPE